MGDDARRKYFKEIADGLVDMCFEIGASTTVEKVNVEESNDNKLCMDENWLFSDWVTCISNDPVYKKIDEIDMDSQVLDDTNPKLSMPMIFLFAAFQYAVIFGNSSAFTFNGGIFGKFTTNLGSLFAAKRGTTILNDKVNVYHA